MPFKVLLADDSMTAQNMGKKILTDAGYQVIAVSNGAQAMKKLASEKPDLVLLDVYMPGYTGLEICERIKSTPESANTPVILCVAKMEPFKAEEGTRVKADAVIIKPFEATDLVARMQEMQDKLARWRASRTEVEESVSRFEPEAEAPVEEEPARNRLEVPEEMAATPAFGMDLEAESAAAAANFTGELVVEHEREPVDISGSSHMVAADGLSGVFEMQQPAAQKTEVQEFEIAAPVAPAAEPEFETYQPADATVETSLAPDPAIERFDAEPESSAETPSAADIAQSSEFEVSKSAPSMPDFGLAGEIENLAGGEDAKLSVEAQADAAAEVEPRSEFVVERISIPVSEAATEVVEVTPLPAESAVSTPGSTEPASVSGDPSSYTPQPATEWQPESSAAVAVAEETVTDFAPSLNWVAEEVALDAGEGTASLEEEMRGLLAATTEEGQASPEAAAPFDAGASGIAASEDAQEPVSAEGEIVSAPEPPGHMEQAIEAAEVIAADAQVVTPPTWPSADSLRCEAEPVIEAAPEPTAALEETKSAPEPAEEANPLASAMAAAIAGNIASADTSAPTDPTMVEQAVDRLLDRLKPDLVSQILRELNKK